MAHVHPGAYPFGAAAGSGGGGGGAVDSVFGRTGDVAAADGDYDSYYVSKSTPQTIAARHTFNPGSALSPFILHANAQGQLVTGLNADLLDGLDSTAFATAAHVHSAADVTSGLLALARGGTHTDLSATGGAKRVLMQESAGADITVRILAAADIPDLSATYQPLDADLTAIGALTSAANKLPYATGSGTWALADFSAAGRELVNDADAAAQRTTLGLGTIATFNDAPSDGSTYGRKNGAWEAVSGGGATTFLALTDTPSAFTSQTLKLVRVNAAETALEFVDGATVYQPLDADLTSWAAVARASGFDTFVATPSSANLRSLLTDETGTGSAVFATSPTLVTPLLGTPTSGVLTNCTGLPASSLVSGIIPEANYIGLAVGLSADGKWCGLTIEGTAGAALAFGDVCYLAVADSRWELADASAASTAGDVQLGICVLAAAADGNATRMLLFGTIRADAAFPALTVGATVHLSETAGDVVVAAPTTTDSVTRRLGFALTADSMMFNPANDYYTHT